MIKTAQGRNTVIMMLIVLAAVIVWTGPAYWKDWKKARSGQTKLSPRQEDEEAMMKRERFGVEGLQAKAAQKGRSMERGIRVAKRMAGRASKFLDSRNASRNDPFASIYPDDLPAFFNPQPPTPLPPPRARTPMPPQAKRSASHLRLQSIYKVDGKYYAMIDNRKAAVNDRIDGGAFTVANISAASVELKNAANESYFLPELERRAEGGTAEETLVPGENRAVRDQVALPLPLYEELYEIAPPQNPNILR